MLEVTDSSPEYRPCHIVLLISHFLYFRCDLVLDVNHNVVERPYNEATQQRRGVININKLGGNLAYNPSKRGFLYDIAILEVDAPFVLSPQVIPAQLPTAKTPTGTNLIVSGWGNTSQGTQKIKTFSF
jgi:Trypsin